MDTRRLKTEPEDLSLQGDEDDSSVVNRDINALMLRKSGVLRIFFIFLMLSRHLNNPLNLKNSSVFKVYPFVSVTLMFSWTRDVRRHVFIL